MGNTPYPPAPGQFKEPLLDKEACRRFSQLSREDKAAFVEQLTEEEARELRYLWPAWARDSQLPPEGSWGTWAIIAGRGCIAAGTLIYDPAQRLSRPVEDLERAGRPITVLSLTNRGIRPARATAPFIKGQAALYRVTLEDGRNIVVTQFHRFLTQQGWKMLASLAKDDLIGCAHGLPGSNWEPVLSMSRASDPRWYQTPASYQDGCCPLPHQYGEQPRWGEDTGQSSAQPPDDEGKCTHFFWQKGAQAGEQGYIHPYPVWDHRLSKRNYAQGVLSQEDEGYPTLPYVFSHIPPRHLAHQQFPVLTTAEKRADEADVHPVAIVERPLPTHADDVAGISRMLSGGVGWFAEKPRRVSRLQSWTNQIHTVRQPVQWEPLSPGAIERPERPGVFQWFDRKRDSDSQSFQGNFLADTVPEWFREEDHYVLSYMDDIPWQRIVSIDFVGCDVFYDLTVPEYANYLANGIWNHNSGKTRSGAEFIRGQVEAGQWGRVALVGRTAADVRDVMIDGESGILAVSHPDFMPKHEATKRRLVWPNGAMATTFSAIEPDSLRGPQHDGGWCDEVAAWQYPLAYDNLMMGLRLGKDPRVIVTTTPKPTAFLKELLGQRTTVKTGGSTYENLDNLAPTFRDQIIAKYSGTHLGSQELLGLLIGEAEGALWTRARLELTRVNLRPDLLRKVVGVDPAVTNEPGSDETGIVVAGLGVDGHFYVLADFTIKASPKDWAERVVAVYDFFQADRIACETNQGGDLLETVLRSVEGGANVAYRKKHAAESKRLRAEPVAMLYEQGRAHHLGLLAELEDEMCSWVQGKGKSPNRLDACVWAIQELMVGSGNIPLVTSASLRRPMAGVSALTQAAYEGQMLAQQTVQHVEAREQAGDTLTQRDQDDLARQAQLSRLLGDLSRLRGGR